MATPLSQTDSASSPQVDYTQEVRFAVVMYGGVSLAIYINGIAQELLRLVRSTSSTDADAGINAAPTPSSELTGTERVYRRLSCLLSDPHLLRDFRASLETAKNQNPTDTSEDIVDKRMAEGIVNTRFIVDILSGTSAGGINAIYLAKALANDQKLDELKTLWVAEGDIALLLNDKQSVSGLHLTNQQPPQSLLNSRRMYFKLLKALRGMEESKSSQEGSVSPHVDELDLFITTTDIEGLPLPLRLSDTVVYERRHRNVFHFKYATPEASGVERNDFLARNDPFLAFAARCTSSFPFAFEPMRLCDIDEVLDLFPEYDDKDSRKQAADRWKAFFRENTGPFKEKAIEFSERSFGDGGYLDNKPFTYATETLTRRDAPVLVDRKLIYIEPSPEHPEDEPLRKDKPQAIENVKAALLDLPSYETIREDLQRLIQRNELLKRVNRITRAIEGDLDKSQATRPVLSAGEWATLDLAGMADRFGIYYIPYRRLRISAATDELTNLIARNVELDESSAQFMAVRYLIHAWREVAYPDYRKDLDEVRLLKELADAEKIQPTANQFLIHFDFKYWLRRVTFVRGKIDQLYRLSRLPAKENGDGVDESKLSATDTAILERLRRLKYNPLDYTNLTGAEKNQLQGVLSFLKCELNELYKRLRVAGRRIQSKPGKNATPDELRFAEAISSIKLDPELIAHLLGLPTRPKQTEGDVDQNNTQQEFSKLDENECIRRAKELLFPGGTDDEMTASPLGRAFLDAGAALSKVFRRIVVDDIWTHGRALLKPTEPLPEACGRCREMKLDSPHISSIREYLWRYFSQFDDYDQISFPILFGTEVGEADVVEVLRISPEDATTLIDERAERQKPNGRKKLAGTALHHFGAFLDKVWRQNDILWGRLDGAERLITAMLPEPEDKKVREKLINEAHSAILLEELTPESRVTLGVLLTDALVRISAGTSLKTAVADVVRPLKDATLRTRLNIVMRAGLENETLLAFIKSSYEVNRDLDAKVMLRSISRSTQVIGRMFEDMANRNNLEGKRLAWIARLGQVFWGLIEVAVPGSILSLFFFHWLKILYAFEVFLILGALLLNAPKEITNFGWTALAITAALNVIVLLLSDYIRGKKAWRHAIFVIGALAFLFFTAIGIDEVFNFKVRSKLAERTHIEGLLFGAAPVSTPTPVPTPIFIFVPTSSPTPYPTLTPTASPTPKATPTATGSSSPSATPSPAPSPTGNKLATPSPGASPPDIDALIRQRIEQLQTGRLAFNPPSQMFQGTRERVEARIAPKDIGEVIKEGLRGRGVPQVEPIPVDTKMKVVLYSTRPDAFDVKIYGEEEKIVSGRQDRPYTDWEWDVTPKASGDQELHLKATVRMTIPGVTEPQAFEVPVIDKAVHVQVSYGYLAKDFLSDKDNLRWVVGGLLTLIGAALGLINRQRIWAAIKRLFGKGGKNKGKGKNKKR